MQNAASMQVHQQMKASVVLEKGPEFAVHVSQQVRFANVDGTKHICSPDLSRVRSEAATLMQGWAWLPLSRTAVVACNTCNSSL